MIWWLTSAGLLAAAVGLVDGIVMALDKKRAPCPDGKYFPEGTTDLTCYAHPQAGIGMAVASMSIVLGTVVMLASIIARSKLARGTNPGAEVPPDQAL